MNGERCYCKEGYIETNKYIFGNSYSYKCITKPSDTILNDNNYIPVTIPQLL